MLNRSWLSVCHAFLIIAGTFAASVGSAHADAPTGIEFTPIAYIPGRGGIQLIKVRVNRTQTATFAFDSGTNYSVISDEVVKRLGIKPFVALTSSGKPKDAPEAGKPTYRALIPSVAVGGIAVLNSPFVVVRARSLSAAFGKSVDGALGANVAAKLPILLDFQKHQLTFLRHSPSPDELKALGMEGASAVPVTDIDKSSHYKFPIKVTSEGISAEGVMLVDTGSDQTYLSASLAAQLHLKPQGNGLLSTFYGPVPTSYTVGPTLRFGEITLGDLPVNYVDKPEAISPFNNNVLGLDVLSYFRVLLDYPGGKIYFQPSTAGAAPPATEAK